MKAKLRWKLAAVLVLGGLGGTLGAQDFQKAMDAWRAQDFSRAVEILEALADAGDPRPEVAYWLGVGAHKLQKYDRGARALETLPRDYSLWPAQWFLADCWDKAGQPEKAVQALNRALAGAPVEGEVWKLHSQRAGLLVKLKDLEALKALRSSLVKVLAGQSGGERDYLYLQMGKLWLEAGAQGTLGAPALQESLPWVLELYGFTSQDYRKYWDFYTPLKQVASGDRKAEVPKLFRLFPPDFPWNSFLLGVWAQSLEDLDRGAEAWEIWLRAWNLKETGTSNGRITAGIRLLQGAGKLGRVKDLVPLQEDLLQTARQSPGNFTWVQGALAEAFRQEAWTLGGAGEPGAAAVWLQRALKVAGTPDPQGKKPDLSWDETFLKAYQFAAGPGKGGLSQAYEHKMILAVLAETDARWKDKEGKPQQARSGIPEAQLKDFQKAGANLGYLIYFYTRGQVRLSVAAQRLPITVKEYQYKLWTSAPGGDGQPLQSVDTLVPNFLTMEPSPGPWFFEQINKYDSIVTVFPSEGVTRVCTASTGGFAYVPYTLQSTVQRPHLVMASQSMTPPTLMHEFFHCFEGLYQQKFPFISHAFRGDFESLWPRWYRGEGEAVYYLKAFELFGQPEGFEALKVRKNQETLTQKDLSAAQKLLESQGPEALRTAGEWEAQAWDAFNQGNHPKALELFRKVLDIRPEAVKVRELVGWLEYKQERWTQALAHYKEAVRLDPQNRDSRTMLGLCYEKQGDGRAALGVFEQALKDFAQPKLEAYMAGRLAYGLKDYPKALKYYQRFLDQGTRGAEADAALELGLWIQIWQTKDPAGAVAWGEAYGALAKSPRTLGVLAFYLAVAQGNLGNLTQARKLLNQAKDLGYQDTKALEYYQKLWK